MNPCELNIAIAVLTNHFYCTLSKEDFVNLGVLLSLLSKDILSMAAIEGLCHWEHQLEKKEREEKNSGSASHS